MALKDSFKLRSQTEMDAEQNKKQEEKTRQHWLSIERNRKQREQYEIKEISTWMYIGPFIGLVVAIIAGILIWLSGDANNTYLWWIVGIGLAPLMLFGVTSDVDDKWKASLSAKREIEKETDKSNIKNELDDYSDSSYGMTINGFNYQHDHIYTDSGLINRFYKFTKFVMGLSTIVFSILCAVLLFIWLGSISIAPTTIIIILLVMILLKK